MTLLQRRASLWLAMSWFLLNIQLEVKAAADRGEATVPADASNDIYRRKILIESPFGVIEATLDIARLVTPGVSETVALAYLSQAIKVASKSWELTELITSLYAYYGGGIDLERNYYAASDSDISAIKNIFEFALKDGYLLFLGLVLPIPGPGRDAIVFAVKTVLDATTGPILEGISEALDTANSYLNRRLVMDALLSGAFSGDTEILANEFVRGAFDKIELDRRLNERGIYGQFETELSAFQQGQPPPFNDAGVSEILIDQQNRI